jgi:hypothetical protein
MARDGAGGCARHHASYSGESEPDTLRCLRWCASDAGDRSGAAVSGFIGENAHYVAAALDFFVEPARVDWCCATCCGVARGSPMGDRRFESCFLQQRVCLGCELGYDAGTVPAPISRKALLDYVAHLESLLAPCSLSDRRQPIGDSSKTSTPCLAATAWCNDAGRNSGTGPNQHTFDLGPTGVASFSRPGSAASCCYGRRASPS